MMFFLGFFAGWAFQAALAAAPAPVSGGLAPASFFSALASPASLLDLDDDALRRRVEENPGSLGSLSLGTPDSAVVINSVSLPADPRWEFLPRAECWATAETVEAVRAVVAKVHEAFPATPPIVIGDIGDPDGGRLKRHASHQAGRDVDFGFFHKTGTASGFPVGTAATLDLPRNWALVRAILTCTDVEVIFLDTGIQKLLYGYAAAIGEDKAWLDRVFRYRKGSSSAVIRYARGHRTHYHVRFYNPVAQELGRRVYPMLVQAKKIKPPVFTVRHVVRDGETLGHLARRYGTSVRAIQQANGLSSSMIRAGRSYRIPLKGVSAPPVKPLIVPSRLLPPSVPDVLAAASWPSAAAFDRQALLKLMEAAIQGAAVVRRV